MRLGLLLSLQFSGALALRTRQDGSSLPQEGVRVTNRFIVEVGAGASLDAASSKIKANGGTILKTFESDIFSGFSVESDGDNVDTLQQIGEVATAWPMTEIKLAPIIPEVTFSNDAAAANYSVHAYTGVEQAHKDGILGKGVTIAVVDTGISYDHPALGGGIGAGYKIAYGHDFVGDGYWPDEGVKVPDEDPMDHVGHGTHVAGIIAGKSEWFTGVAPEATLLAYKVFTEAGGTDDATLIEAFLSAYNRGVDIITASIGGPSGWHTNPWGVVASRIVDQGVVVTISAGNSGRDGPFYGSSGSSGKNVIAVASLDPMVLSADPFQAIFSLDGVSNTTTLAYRAGSDPWRVKGLRIVPLTLNATVENDACSTLPTTADLSNVISLVRRGGCTFEQKQNNLKKAGAQNILFYNNDSPLIAPSSPASNPIIGMIEKKAGEAIIATVKAGGSVTVDFTLYADYKVGAYNSAGGIPSEFTSWGGSFDLDVKPDIGAPGRSILAPYLEKSYAALSGTSMSCPYVAGVVALYISKFGGRDVHGPGFAKKLANRIISSGNSVPWQVQQPTSLPINYGFWAPVMQVGNGAINAQTILNAQTSLDFEKFALNDTGHFSRYQKVHITNEGKEPVTYSFALQPAGTFDAQSENPSYLASFLELVPYEFVPKVSFPSGKFSVQPGETKTAQFNFEPPQGLDEAQMPSYSGKILITGSNGDQLSVPYMGVGFNLKEKLRRSMFSETTPFQVAGTNRDNIDVHHRYTFDVRYEVQDFPKVYIELKWGTKELRWDIFEAGWKEHDWKYPPVVGENGYIGSATYWNQSNYGYRDFDPSTYDKDATTKFPEPDLYRNSLFTKEPTSFWWLGKMSNGTYIQPGNYTMRFAALVPFGNPDHSDNWDIWETPEIQVAPQKA